MVSYEGAQQMIEYSITVKNESTKLVEKGIEYNPLMLSRDNPALIEKVNDIYAKFKASFPALEQDEKPDIIIKTTMMW
jgi:hypothetical protein